MALLSSASAASSATVSGTGGSDRRTSLAVPGSATQILRHGFTPSPSLPALDSPRGLLSPANLFSEAANFDVTAFAAASSCSSSPNDIDLLSSFGTPFAALGNVAAASTVFDSAAASNNVVPSMPANGFAPDLLLQAASGASVFSSFPTGFDFSSTFGTPFDMAPMDVAVGLSPVSPSASSNVSSKAFNGYSAVPGSNAVSVGADMFMFGNHPASSTSNYSSPSQPNLDFFSSFGTPFPASMDAAAGLSFDSSAASSNVFSMAGIGSADSSLNWLDSLMSVPQAAPVSVVSATAGPAKKAPRASKTPSSPALSVTKGNRETAVSSVYQCKVVGNKQTVEYPSSCKSCGVAVATMILRGSVDSFQAGYLVEVTCDSCSQSDSRSVSPVADIPNLKIIQSRKRARKINDDGKAVHCDVCQTHVGTGGVQVIDTGAVKRHCGEGQTARKSDSFSVEVVCAGCRDHYGFCTECGGGGKYRTGKYRPFELFQDGRRTCSLPHFRLGDTKATHTFVPVSASNVSPMGEGKTIFLDSYISQHAVPKQLSGANAVFSSAAAIQQSAEALWSKEESRVASSTSGQYIAFASIPKSSRKKSRAATATAESADIQMACITAEHAVHHSVLEIKQVASRVTAAQSSALLAEMVRNAVASLPSGSVQHVLLNSAVVSAAQIEKLGAVAVESYLSSSKSCVGAVYLRQRAVEESLGVGSQMFVVSASALV
ncbi:hypothetical protein BCR33DRAFT_711078 [Rhizoclosmatium globosum]|uniref:Uncharacterized protein n=1 Tax=Rhizoclosmatium globosum TaxID=329046 RepID=A0A1Y2D341_9FUNG|nr:hypothetical protein BCR33DRAFT_711078 [Rhizoclosmatium globosum]|eukprot:ORY53718.1 hypothetical protein BCR33DRAFT_711078 [Rhizoclosmatium globosum]